MSEHSEYPHGPGALYGCAACEAECFCEGRGECVRCALQDEGTRICNVATGSFVRVLSEDGTTIVEGPCSLWGDSERVTLRVHPMTLGAWLAWELAPRETVAVDVAYGAPVFCESANVRGRVYLVDVDR